MIRRCSVRVWLLAAVVLFCPPQPPAGADRPPDSFRLKTKLEIDLERIIDKAYRSCTDFRKVGGADLLLRIPFGQSGERRGSPGFHQHIFLGGKGDPAAIWAEIDRILASAGFAAYVSQLEQPGDKTVAFDLEGRRVSVFFDPGLNELLREGLYPGTRTKVYVLKTGSRISVMDVYNFLYCVGAVGLDCSGFVYNVQKSIAGALGRDLDEALRSVLGADAGGIPKIAGLWLFNPQASFSTAVEDRIENLRPGDIILFRGRVPGRGIRFRHSGVICSVDFASGLIRYLQCTDWATPEQRGVHDSWIRFDPARSRISLADPSLEWLQTIQPAFDGETPLRYWKNDGHRYRSYQEEGGSLIVRLKMIQSLIEAAEPGFYDNKYGVNDASS
jgi:hypothetical protein